MMQNKHFEGAFCGNPRSRKLFTVYKRGTETEFVLCERQNFARSKDVSEKPANCFEIKDNIMENSNLQMICFYKTRSHQAINYIITYTNISKVEVMLF